MSDQARILVVDDERTLRDIVSRALVKLGHECVTAANGEEALRLLAKQAFDLVITDLKMPRMNGLALVEWLREGHPEIPIIIMTGYADLESARKALRLRVSDYLVKPFEGLAEVQAAVQRALQTRTARADTGTLLREFEKRAREFDRREGHLTGRLERAQIEIKALAKRLEQSETVALRQVGQVGELIENLEHGILVTDTAGTVLSTNRELRAQFQVPNSRGTGCSVDRLPGDSVLREAVLESRNRLCGGSEEPVFARTTDSSGVTCGYEVRSARIVGQDGDATGILTTIRPARWKSARGTAKKGGRARHGRLAPWS